MQAVLLAGGLGTRLRPLTDTRPKALLPLVNRPLILHVLERLPSQVDEVLIAAGHGADLLASFFRKEDVGRPVSVVREEEPLGTGGGLRNVADRLSGTFFACNADVIASLAVSDLIAAHRRNGGIGTIALWEVEDPSAYGVVGMKGDRITRFVEKPTGKAPSRLVNAGMYVFEREILDHIPAGREVSLEREVYPKVIRKRLFGFRFEGYWTDVGTPANFLRATSILLHHRGGAVNRTARVAAGAHVTDPVTFAADSEIGGEVGPVVTVGRGCRIGKARVRDSILFDAVHVSEGATVMNSLVGEGCRIGRRAVVSDAILADGVKVSPGRSIVGERVAA